MAHIVYVAAGRRGPLNSSFELSRRLTDAGHRVTYLSHANVGEIVAAQGYPFERLRRDKAFAERLGDHPAPWRGRRVPSPGAVVRWVRYRRGIRWESARQTEVEERLRELRPDLVLSHVEAHFVILATLSLGIPLALVCSWFTVFHSPGVPPLHSSVVPGDSLRARLAVRMAWARARGTRWRQEWYHRLFRVPDRALRPIPYSTVWVDDLRLLARAKGIDPSRDLDRRHWLRPWVYPRLPLISLNLEALEFPTDRPVNLRYVGPMVARQRREVGRGDEDPSWPRLQARRASSPEARPLVYCAMGSYWQADLGFLLRVVEALSQRPEWDVVLGLGSRVRPEDLGPIPDHVLCLEWAPQLEILAEADCALIHGGINSINECLSFGVPMAVYSLKVNDQNGSAARVEYHGLGVVGDKDRDSAETIGANVEWALTDTALRTRVEEVRDLIRESERSDLAVRTIEALMAEAS